MRRRSDGGVVINQLRDALVANSLRVMDLFREWDANGDGQIKYDELRGRLRNFASERRTKAS